MFFVSRVWRQLVDLFANKTITVLTVLFCLGIIGVLANISRLSDNLIVSQALQNAALSAEIIKEARSVYNSEAVNHVDEIENVTVTHDYVSREDAIPLPATYLLELSRQIRDKNPGMSIRLYSDYPFPWRKDEGGPQNSFEWEALNQLRDNPDRPFYRIEKVAGLPVLKYAEADILKPSCVSCHNTYPGTPKTDWKIGDVRGIFEVTQPLGAFKLETRNSLRDTFVMLGGLSAVGIAGLTLAMKNLRQNSQELAQSKEQLEAVLDAVPGAIAWIDSDATFVGVNRHLAEDWNVSPEALVGKEVGFLRGSDRLAQFIRQFLASDTDTISQVIELQINQRRQYYLLAAQKYSSGEAVVSVGIDISESQQAKKALKLSEAKFRNLVFNIPGAIYRCRCDANWTIQFISDAISEIAVYPASELLDNRTRNYTSLVYAQDRQLVRQTIDRALDNKEPFTIEYRIIHQNGDLKWVYEQGRGVFNSQNQPLYYILTEQFLTLPKPNRHERLYVLLKKNIGEFLKTPLRVFFNLRQKVNISASILLWREFWAMILQKK
ncbi:c-type heme family protein [Myxosarcina sp. GI1(2024)]